MIDFIGWRTALVSLSL